MSDQNSPEVSNSSPDSREAIKRSISDKLDAMQQKIDDEQRQKILTFIQDEKLSEETLKNVDRLLQEAQRAHNSNPVQAMQIMNAILITGADGEISQADVRGALNVPPGSEAAQKIGGAVEKMTSLMNGLTAQLGALGSGTMKMLEDMFGPDTFFGKIFAYLKNTPQAQATYLVKKLEEQEMGLDKTTNHQEVLRILRRQIVKGQNKERSAGKTVPTYDIVQHADLLMAEVDTSLLMTDDDTGLKLLTLKDIEEAGEAVLDEYQPVPVIAPVVATKPPERVRNPVTGAAAFETAISTESAGNLTALFNAGKATITAAGKSGVIEKIGDKEITAMNILEAQGTDAAVMIFTLAGGSEVAVSAPVFKIAAEKAAAKSTEKITGKTLTPNGQNVDLEVLFS